VAPLTAQEVFAKMQAQSLSVQEVWKRVEAAEAASDWEGVLKWEGRMEEMLTAARQPDGEWVAMGGTGSSYGSADAECDSIILTFSLAHGMTMQAKVSRDQPSHMHVSSIVGLGERRIELLGNMERFRDMGELMCSIAVTLKLLGRNQDAAIYYQRARDVGAAHGFFSVESAACIGLGEDSVDEGRDEGGMDLLRNTLVHPLL